MAELFRKSALDTLATPEQLDKQVKIVRPSVWIVCMALLVGVVTFILWSFTYHISNGVNAEGVVFSNHNVVQIKAERNCIVTDVLAVRGEYVETGDIIAVVSNDELLQEIEADRIALDAMETEDEAYAKSSRKITESAGFVCCSYCDQEYGSRIYPECMCDRKCTDEWRWHRNRSHAGQWLS